MSFSRQHGVSYQTFIAWVRKRRECGNFLPSNAPAFAEVLLQQPSHDPSAGLRIVLPCGTVIEIFCRSALPLAAELITTLRPMLTLSGSLGVFLGLESCDMRKSFDRLHAEVINRLSKDSHDGAVFVFINRSRNHLKLLQWDGPGSWVRAKRFEYGSYRWPRPAEPKTAYSASNPQH